MDIATFGDPCLNFIYQPWLVHTMRTLKFRIEPNSKQRRQIDINIEANRLTYNALLTACKMEYRKTGTLLDVFSLNRICTRIRNNCPFIGTTYAMILQDTSRRVHHACKDSLAEHCKESEELNIEDHQFHGRDDHFPRYRKPERYKSYAYPSNRGFSFVICMDENGKECRKLKLAKVSGEIRCYNQFSELRGEMKTCNISRKNMGTHFEYYASIVYEDIPKVYPVPKGPIGVDIGISNIVALSDGTIFQKDSVYSKKEKEFQKLHRKFSKTCQNTSKNHKAKAKLNHAYNKIVNHRKDNVEQISNYIVKNHDVIVMEDLSVRKLRSISKSRKMTKRYNDASLGLLRRRICDKAESAGRTIILVDPKDTSQICSQCGSYVKKDLSVRTHVCTHCGYTADRDVNAARNILARAPHLSLQDGPAILSEVKRIKSRACRCNDTKFQIDGVFHKFVEFRIDGNPKSDSEALSTHSLVLMEVANDPCITIK